MKLRALPADVEAHLTKIGAPKRLRVHLQLVHDVAVQLSAALTSLTFDRSAVAFGAATHDIGKALHPHELSGSGSAHELAGYEWLIAQGEPEARARFARTHAKWADADATIEDLLVSLADKVWKGRREEELEQKIVARIAKATGQQPWDVFMKLDELLGELAAEADARLALQQQP